jgi:hypothetical protein
MITISWVQETTRTQPEGGDAFELDFSLINLDILETENYESTSTITMHAVEEGVPTSDHSVLNADKVSFTVVVSDRQSNTRLALGVLHGSTVLQGGLEASGIIVPDDLDRRGDVFDELLRLKNERIRVSVDGLQRSIEEWLIESISTPRSVDTGGTLVCELVLSEIRTAVLEEIDAPSPRVERGRGSSNNQLQVLYLMALLIDYRKYLGYEKNSIATRTK